MMEPIPCLVIPSSGAGSDFSSQPGVGAGMRDISARISYLIFSHYLANIVISTEYCDIYTISEFVQMSEVLDSFR